MKKNYVAKITFWDKEKCGHTIQTKNFKTFDDCFDKMCKKISILEGQKNIISECSVILVII